MLDWRDVYADAREGFVFHYPDKLTKVCYTIDLEAQTCSCRQVDCQHMQSAEAASMYFNTFAECLSAKDAAFAAKYDKWWPQRAKQMARFPHGDVRREKMDAFYAAMLDVWKVRQKGGKNTRTGDALDYLYNQQEGNG